MKIQDLKDLDLYKCSLQDINKAYNVLSIHLQKVINKGGKSYNEVKDLHILISRARVNMMPNGQMASYNIDSNRLPNSKSVL